MSTSERRQQQLLFTAMAVGFVTATWAVLSVSKSVAAHFNLAAYLLTNVIVFVDAIDLLCRTAALGFGRREQDDRPANSQAGSRAERPTPAQLSLAQKRLLVKPWAIAVSVYNAESALFEFLGSIDYLRDRMWIVDDGSSDGTCEYLRNIGWRCLRIDKNLKKPGAIEKLVEQLPPEVATVVIIDPDVDIASRNGLGLAVVEEVIFDFQQSGRAAMCPRLAVRSEGFLSKFQMLEYCLAFYGRRSLGDSSITSGISVYRRSTFSTMLVSHTKSVYAEDLENSILLLGMGQKIRTERRLVIHTEAKTSFRGWFSQRIGWSYGLIKVYFERFRDIRRIGRRSKMNLYHYIGYMGIFNLACHPLKIMSLGMITASFCRGGLALIGVASTDEMGLFEPVYFLSTFGKYLILMIVTWLTVVEREERMLLLPILPLYLLYALFQTVATTVGYINWITLRLFGLRMVKDHYDDGEEARFRRRRGAPATCLQ